jgi:hypothetical protein
MVQLSGNPNGARTLNLVSSNLLAVTLSTSTLTFNATNWNVPQSVTMTGVSDANDYFRSGDNYRKRGRLR